MTLAVAMNSRNNGHADRFFRVGRRVLAVPLIAKVLGANVVIVAAAVTIYPGLFRSRTDVGIATMVAALAVASLVNFLLVRIALSPVEDLQLLAERVSAGDFGARGRASPFADAGLCRLGRTVNGLLDALATERKRIQDLGAEVAYAQDAERARVSRELHDSIAQTLVAARFQLSAASVSAEGELRSTLATASGLVGSALEEVKKVSYSLHARVADDLGLEAALGALARQVEQRSGVEVSVRTDLGDGPISSHASATLFRVVQESLRNIEVHSRAESATVSVVARNGSIRVEVADNGCGFDSTIGRIPAVRSALSSVRDRITLAGGVLKIHSIPNEGTRVTAELGTSTAGS